MKIGVLIFIFCIFLLGTVNALTADSGCIWQRTECCPCNSGGASSCMTTSAASSMEASLIAGGCPQFPNCVLVYLCSSTDTHCKNVGGSCVASPSCVSNSYSSCYNNDRYWYDSCGVRESKRQECGSPGTTYSSNFCLSDDVYRTATTWDMGCSSDNCYSTVTSSSDQKVSECGTTTTGSWGADYCKAGDVYRSRTDLARGCSSGSCYANNNVIEELVQACISGEVCSGGACIASCIPQTCTDLGRTCGSVGDGCGVQLDCGSCGAGYTCSGTGVCTLLADPTETISTCQELQDIQDDLTKDYELISDIDCVGFSFQPIGGPSAQFSGSLDGRGYSIIGLSMTNFDVSQKMALFGVLGPTAQVRNLGLENVDIEGSVNVGSVAGYSYGDIRNVYVTGTIYAKDGGGSAQSSGGLVGVNKGLIKNSYVDLDVSFGGGHHMGGLVGVNTGDIIYSHSSGTMTIAQEGSWSSYYGGLVGYSTAGEIRKSYSTMDLSGRGSYVGGFMGRCLAHHGITTTCKILESYATGNIPRTGSTAMSGGFLGMHDGEVSNSYSRGKVDISGNGAGGFCGYLSHGYVSATYSTGDVDSGYSPRGGFSGYSYASKGLNSYWDTQTSGLSSSGFGYGRTTSQMKTQATFSGWDFANIWQIDPTVNNGYPFLQWQTEGCIPDGCNGDCHHDCTAADDPDCDMTTYCCGDFICNGNEVPGFSDTASECKTDCGEPGAFCGDGLVNTPLEDCDLGASNGISCSATYGTTCNYCSGSCINTTLVGGFCGDNVPNGPETCDHGIANTDTPCDPTGIISCTYCDTSCVEYTIEERLIFWRNLNGEEITHADVGDTVQMVQIRSPSGTFEIREADGAIDDESNGGSNDDAIRSGSEAISGGLVGKDIVGTWKILQEDLDKTEDYDHFYFTVNGMNSDFLNISFEGADEPMNIVFESPPCGQHFIVKDTSLINVSVSDPDSVVLGNLTIGGDVYEFSNEGTSFNYDWNRSGNIQIELFAINDKMALRRTITSVMVIDPTIPATYLAACIDKPADFSDINYSTVWFDAGNSKGIRNESGTLEIILPERLLFTWSFSDGLRKYIKKGDAPDELAYRFHKNFATAGHNWAVLDVKIA